MAQAVFNRYEKKYMLPDPVYQNLLDRLEGRMVGDEYGLHTICNLYYDTESMELIRRSVDKPVYKEKLRLRSYGVPTPDSMVFVEIKKKYRKVVNKRRISIKLGEAYELIGSGREPQSLEDTYTNRQILSEIQFLCGRQRLKPAMFIAYDRIAMKCPFDEGFRLTFDTLIRNRTNSVGMEKGDGGAILLPRGYHLMETKIMGATPAWFSKILSDLAIYSTSFSKYGNFYKRGLSGFSPITALTHRLENWEAIGADQRPELLCA